MKMCDHGLRSKVKKQKKESQKQVQNINVSHPLCAPDVNQVTWGLTLRR